jgi:hypothetical protein
VLGNNIDVDDVHSDVGERGVGADGDQASRHIMASDAGELVVVLHRLETEITETVEAATGAVAPAI